MGDRIRFTPGGPRPAENVHLVVPEDERAVPPGGPRHRSRVRRVESGARLEFRASLGARLRAGNNPGPPDQANWITYAGWTNTSGSPITQFSTTWSVPPAPAKQASQLLYVFNGIEPADGQVILQPVLQWGDSGADEDGQNRTGAFWTVASWMVGGPDGAATHTPHIRVNPGDVLVGVMTLTNQTPAGFVYTCEFQGLAGTSLTTPQMAELVWCVETLEAYELEGNHVAPYDLDSAGEYPGSAIVFEGIDIVTHAAGPGGGWSVQNLVTQYGENTTIEADTACGGRIVIAF